MATPKERTASKERSAREGRWTKIGAIATVLTLIITYFGVAAGNHWPPFQVSSSQGKGGSLPAGASSTATAQYVMTPESCAVYYDVEGYPSPVLCKDGRPSLVVDHWYRQRHFKVFSLGPTASPDDVIAAICSDLASNPTVRALPHESFSVESGAVELWEAEEKWQSARVPVGDIASIQGDCTSATSTTG
jgi:hypothetical protein